MRSISSPISYECVDILTNDYRKMFFISCLFKFIYLIITNKKIINMFIFNESNLSKQKTYLNEWNYKNMESDAFMLYS
jgi:hypothetical protein